MGKERKGKERRDIRGGKRRGGWKSNYTYDTMSRAMELELELDDDDDDDDDVEESGLGATLGMRDVD